MICFCGILRQVLALAALANQKLCRICGSKLRNQLYPNNHRAISNLVMLAFQRLPQKHLK
jgi:hypothetical protein